VNIKWLKLFIKHLFRNRKFLLILLIITLMAVRTYAAPYMQLLDENTDPSPPPDNYPDPDPDPL